MKITTLIPDQYISRYVKGIFVLENSGNNGRFMLPLFANGCPTLVFNSGKSASENKNVSHLTLYGQTIHPGQLTIKGEFTLIAYYFYPYALNSLFQLHASEFTNRQMEMNFMKQAKEINLQEQLLNSSTLQNRLILINNFIRQLMDRAAEINLKAEFVIKKIKSSNGQLALHIIQKELNITERTLQRLFEVNVGISPKMYSRVCQFDSALQQLNNFSSSSLVDIAYNSGFADQSHFCRVFKEFTHLTPVIYIEKVKSLSLDS